MSKELMREMLEFLEGGDFAYPTKLATDLREELAKPNFWEGYVPEPVGAVGSFIKSESPLGCNGPTGPAQQDSTCNNTLRAQGKAYPRTCKKCGKGPCVGLAQQALDKKAENARELGLDYEPAQQEQWDAIPDAFNEWWNADYDDTGNPYRKDSPAYWAWSGWKAASKQPEQEPVAWVCNGTNSHHDIDFFEEDVDSLSVGTQLYTSPPAQRTWVALTDEEMFEAIRQLYSSDKVARLAVSHSKDEYRAIEAKLKEKNT